MPEQEMDTSTPVPSAGLTLSTCTACTQGEAAFYFYYTMATTLNMTFTLLTDLKAGNTVLLTVGTVLNLVTVHY